MVGFAAAGFCACGAFWTIGSPPDHVPTVFALIPWLYALAFGLAGVALFLFSLAKLRQHPDMMRATERAYLISLFEELGKEDIFLSADEVADFIRSVPDWMSPTVGNSESVSGRRAARN
jgi:hypothetical protein